MNTETPSLRLRGHHLLCMLTWAGRGYTPCFTKAFDNAVLVVKAGGVIEIVAGPDDLCRTLCHDTTPDYHCREARIDERDAMALQDVGIVLGKSIKAGDRLALTFGDLETMRAHFKGGTIRAACVKCEFEPFCTELANDDFKETKL